MRFAPFVMAFVEVSLIGLKVYCYSSIRVLIFFCARFCSCD